jgi:hypothetical protein
VIGKALKQDQNEKSQTKCATIAKRKMQKNRVRKEREKKS